jgi:hypothetical protein
MVDDPCTAAQRRLREEIRQLMQSGHYYPIFQAVCTSSPATIRFIGRGSHPGHTLACQRTDLLALIQQQSLVLDAQTSASYDCHLPWASSNTCAGTSAPCGSGPGAF